MTMPPHQWRLESPALAIGSHDTPVALENAVEDTHRSAMVLQAQVDIRNVDVVRVLLGIPEMGECQPASQDGQGAVGGAEVQVSEPVLLLRTPLEPKLERLREQLVLRVPLIHDAEGRSVGADKSPGAVVHSSSYDRKELSEPLATDEVLARNLVGSLDHWYNLISCVVTTSLEVLS